MRLRKKRFRLLPTGGLRVSPSFKKAPQYSGNRGLIETMSVFSICIEDKKRNYDT